MGDRSLLSGYHPALPPGPGPGYQCGPAAAVCAGPIPVCRVRKDPRGAPIRPGGGGTPGRPRCQPGSIAFPAAPISQQPGTKAERGGGAGRLLADLSGSGARLPGPVAEGKASPIGGGMDRRRSHPAPDGGLAAGQSGTGGGQAGAGPCLAPRAAGTPRRRHHAMGAILYKERGTGGSQKKGPGKAIPSAGANPVLPDPIDQF